MEIEGLLDERSKTHGDYTHQSDITGIIKHVMHTYQFGHKGAIPWEDLSPPHQEALDMIALKIGRILAGDPDFRDHWDDIAGYAKLAADRCSK